MIPQVKVESCPTCYKPAVHWFAKEAYHSRDMYWYGCKRDGHVHMCGGVSEGAAVTNWNRYVFRLRIDKACR